MITFPIIRTSGMILLGTLPTAYSQVGGVDIRPTPDLPLPSQRAAARMEITKLIARIQPVGRNSVRGTVVFEKSVDGVKIFARLSGLPPAARFSLRIHEFGDFENDDASGAGGPFHPGGPANASPADSVTDSQLHSDADGNATLTLMIKGLSLDGHGTGIVGRSVILHSNSGIIGSGTGGQRIAAGVIGISRDNQQGLNLVPPIPGTGATR